MISKYLPLVAVAAIALVWSVSPVADLSEVTYSPRSVETEIQRDAAGAAEITRMLLADVETGEINSQGLAELREDVLKHAAAQARQNSKSTDLAWAEMGPDNIGGRTRAIVAVTEDLIYAGSVSGGLWKSTDGANTWNQVTGMPFMMIASLAVANNGDIYVGTGSAFDFSAGDGASGFRGRGIWWSNDGGETFNIVEGTDPGDFSGGNWSSNDALVKHPIDENRVWYGSNSSFGTIEDGVIDINPATGVPALGVTDIAIAPDASYMLVAASNARVYRSTNAQFSNFETIASGGSGNGALPQSGIGRARIAISQDDPNHAFALFATSGGSFQGLYHSEGAAVGGSWSVCWPGGVDISTPLPRSQGIYDLALGIKKGQPDLAYVGGISLWRSGPNQQAEPAAASFNFPGFPYGVHADLHEIIFTEEGTMFIASDGGIYKSEDGGTSYVESNNNYNVTQFYGIAHSAGTAVLGGTQDNGSLFIPGDGYFLTEEHAMDVNGGDGFDCGISQVTESIEHTYAWFAASQNGGLTRGTVSPGAPINLGGFYDDDIIELIDDEGDLGQFYTCLRLFEDTEDEDSQQNIILVNPYGETVTDSTFLVFTNSQNLPLEYTLAEGEELLFYDEIVRPERLLDDALTEDPDYFWLAPQVGLEQFVCWDDTLGVDTVDVILEIIPNLVDTSIVIDGVEYDVTINIGNDTIFESEIQFDIVEMCDTMFLHEGDTILDEPGRILLQDPYTAMLTIGFVGNQGVWMTREGLNFNTTPDWYRLGAAPGGGGTKSIEYVVNDDVYGGDVMFVSGWSGSLTRFSGLKDVYSQEDADESVVMDVLISSAGSTVTGVSIDPNDANHVVFTVGGYGNVSSGKVRESWDAMSESPTFSNIWSVSDLSAMPIYDVVIDSQDESGATIIIGTEYGTYITDNGGDDWTMSNLGMALTAESLTAPVYDLKQQWRSETNWSNPTNTGAIYAGTHGRGIFRSDSFLGADEVVTNPSIDSDHLLIYPNPVIGGTVQISTSNFVGNTSIEVYDLQGRVVYSNLVIDVNSSDRVLVDVSDLNNGTYVVRMSSELKTLASKLIIRR